METSIYQDYLVPKGGSIAQTITAFLVAPLGFESLDDVLIAISGSGNSENIIKAAKVALSKGMPVISMTGFIL